ncbi:hypothetical protein [Flagellimonas pacifica]|uniref:Saccharopine dehydrogenase, NADP-dependent n=1 Tax=Flagellimonas pacifica TaxID=1247520 RepID=A0A285MWA6_9FLAO|nr:hypothetical protein [Allomuricauda parva]SNZ01398.1 Saccharopine dehydrogenase, NADP-dependent [Allomuricauda parva]
MKSRDKILIIGGYGTVGSIVSRQLAMRYPSKVIIAGRNKDKAVHFIREHGLSASAIYMDIEMGDFQEVRFDMIHTVVNCLETMDMSFLLECINLNINYTEVGASFETHKRFFELSEYIDNGQGLVIPSVGLIPGLSNILAYNGAKEFTEVREIHSYVMLGLGESHGIDSIRWMLKKTNSAFKIKTKKGKVSVRGFTNPKSTRLLNEKRGRAFYLFDFSDHHIIPLFVDVEAVDTRIAFDSRLVTKLFHLFQKTGILKWYERLNPKQFKRVLDFLPIGSERFALQVEIMGCDSLRMSQKAVYIVTGDNEALATATVTSFAAELLYKNTELKGLKHIEEILDFRELVKYLEKHNITIKNERGYENNTVQPSGKPRDYGVIG